MNRKRWREISRHLDRLLPMAPEARSSALEALAEESPEVERAVRELLQADGAAADFLSTPAAVFGAEVWSSLGEDGRGTDTPASEDEVLPTYLGPYRIEEKLGEGGMGEVFAAWDERLERPVAVKRLPVDWGHDRRAMERFRREARAVSHLDHPNICTVFDLDTSADGRLYLVMALYRGVTLAQRLEEGPLDWPQVVEILRQVARGLAHAHRHGIVHRDIKPANLMLLEDEEVGLVVKILDFGIAKSLQGTALTRTGGAPGTPAYMSPEQRAGGAVDGRTDLWALGAVATQLLTGRRPQGVELVDKEDRRRLRSSLRTSRPMVPRKLTAVLERLLTADPEARYPSAEALLEDLGPGMESGRSAVSGVGWPGGVFPGRRWGGVVAILLLAAVILWWSPWRSRPEDPVTSLSPPSSMGDPSTSIEGEVTEDWSRVPSIGVLPLLQVGSGSSTASEDFEATSLGEGLAQLVRDQLTQRQHLQVASMRRLAPLISVPSEDREALAERSGLSYLLSGEIRTVDDGGSDAWHVMVRWVEIASGRQVAALRRTVATPGEVLGLSQTISDEVRRSLAIPPQEAVDVFTADFAVAHPLAYTLFVEGLDHFVAYRLEAAEDSWRQALELAPDFSMARYRLAHVLAVGGRTTEAREAIQRAASESRWARRRQRLYIEALAAYIERDLNTAWARYDTLCTTFPYDTEARYLRAQVAYDLGRYEEVLADAEMLTRLEPSHHIGWSLRGGAHLALGNAQQAVLDFSRYVRLEENSANAHHLLADAYRAQGELELAAGEYRRALEIDPQFHYSEVALAQMLALSGAFDEAEERLRDLVSQRSAAPRWRLDAAFELAYLEQASGRFERAIETLGGVDDLLREEGVRHPAALAFIALCHLELGDLEPARRAAETALEAAPGVSTRYLFVLASVHLAAGEWEDVATTAEAIGRLALPPEDPDRTEDKAVAFLRGQLALQQGDLETADLEWTRAVTLQGYEYTLYRRHLAGLYMQRRDWPLALATLHQAAADRDPLDPRLDLELERRRALLWRAQVQHELGRPEAARALSETLSVWWSRSDGLEEERARLERWRNVP